jgi:hypothetical protein
MVFSLLFTVSIAIVMIFAMRQWTKNRRNETITEEELLGLPHYRCPKCGVSMKPGLAMAARGMMWHRRRWESAAGNLPTP